MPLQRRAQSLKKREILWQLFFSFLKVGAFTWGGGYAMLPLIKREIVEKNRFVSEEGFIEGVSVAQSLPGAIAVNVAHFVGRKLAGTGGALVASLGAVLPSFLIILALATSFLRYREVDVVKNFFYGAVPAIVALIGIAVMDFGKNALHSIEEATIAVSLFLFVFFFNIHPLWIVILGGIVGLLRER